MRALALTGTWAFVTALAFGNPRANPIGTGPRRKAEIRYTHQKDLDLRGLGRNCECFRMGFLDPHRLPSRQRLVVERNLGPHRLPSRQTLVLARSF
jgi:hypothetical protein